MCLQGGIVGVEHKEEGLLVGLRKVFTSDFQIVLLASLREIVKPKPNSVGLDFFCSK